MLNFIDSHDYVLSTLNPDYFSGSEKDKLTMLIGRFNDEYNHEYNQKRYIDYVLRFSEWLRGLPTGLDFVFYNGDILDLLESKGVDVSTEEKQDCVLDCYWMWLSKGYLSLAKKNGVI